MCTMTLTWYSLGVFPKWSRTSIELIEFKESDKLLKHRLGSTYRSCLIFVLLVMW